MFNNDLLWLFFTKFLKLNSRLRSLLFAIGIGTFTFLVLPFFSGYLFPQGDRLSSLDDWPGLIITFFTHPAIYLYYCCEQERIFSELMAKLATVQSAEDHPEFEEQLRKTLNLKIWPVLALFLTVGGYILHIQAVLAHPTLSYYYPNKWTLFFVNAPLSSLAGYMICLIAIRYLLMVMSLFKLFRYYSPEINIFHPDGCGGLSFIGKFVLRSFILVAIMAIDLSLLIVINLEQSNRNPLTEPSFLSLLAFYLILLPISFVVPLLSPRNNIRSIRSHWRSTILDEIERLSAILSKTRKEILDADEFEYLLRLRRLYKLSNLSVIPIDKATLIQFMVLVIISGLPILFLVVSQIFSGGAR